MAIIWMDNFSMYGYDENFLLSGVYGEKDDIVLTNDPDGVSSGQVLLVEGGAGSSTGFIRYVLPSAKTTVGSACRVYLSALPAFVSNPVSFCQFRDINNANQYTIVINTTGYIQIKAGGTEGTQVAITTTPVVSAQAWYHTEVKYSPTEIEVRIEGIPVLTYSGSFSPTYQVAFENNPTSGSSSTNMYIKDFVIWDDTGTKNTSFLGAVLVVSMIPENDVALNWTPSSGSNGWSILDNNPPVDTTYLSAPNPAPDPYVATLTNLPENITSVKGLMPIVRAAKTDGGDASLQLGLVSGTNTALGTDRPITVAMTYWKDIIETDPDTSDYWTVDAANAVKLQLDRTS